MRRLAQRRRDGAFAIALFCSSCSWLLDFDALKDRKRTLDTDGSAPARPADHSAKPDDGAVDAQTRTSASQDADAAAGIEPGTSPSGPGGLTHPDSTRDAGLSLRDASIQSPADAGDAGLCTESCDDRLSCTNDLCVSGECKHQDVICPTTDVCAPGQCLETGCVNTPIVGLAATAYAVEIPGDRIFKSDLVAARDRFFRASYGIWNGEPDVIIESFQPDDGTRLDRVRLSQALPSDDYAVAGPAALVADSRIGLDLHVYVALRQLLPISAEPAASDAGTNSAELDDAGTLFHFVFNRQLTRMDDMTSVVANPPNVRLGSQSVGPVAGQPVGRLPFVAWNGCSVAKGSDPPKCIADEADGDRGGIYLQSGTDQLDLNSPGEHFIPDTGVIRALSPINTTQDYGALWLSDNAGVTAVRIGLANGEPASELTRCAANAGWQSYAADTALIHESLWQANWSSRNGARFATEQRHLGCDSDTCTDLDLPAGECSSAVDTSLPDVRSVVTRTWQHPDDPETVYRAVASIPMGGEEGVLKLKIDALSAFQGADADVAAIGAVTTIESAPGSAPDRVSLAPLTSEDGTDSIAVSWIEAATSSDSQDKLHIQTFRLCYAQ